MTRANAESEVEMCRLNISLSKARTTILPDLRLRVCRQIMSSMWMLPKDVQPPSLPAHRSKI
jgi:hypothetical protein